MPEGSGASARKKEISIGETSTKAPFVYPKRIGPLRYKQIQASVCPYI
jgi:hypothetical protein